MDERRLLFASYHCFMDLSSGAAISGRDLLHLLAGRGWQSRVFSGPQLDFEEGRPLPQLLHDFRLPFTERRGTAGDLGFALLDLQHAGIPVTLFQAPAAPRGAAPGHVDGGVFLALFEQVLQEFRPNVVLTYGGHWLAEATIARARRRGVPVVFWLRNCAYREADLFRQVNGILVPSEFTARHYLRTLGLTCTALPSPLDWDRLRCPEVEGRYVTFVNPQPHKGLFVFARIAVELARHRPDIPLLVVEGRGRAGWLRRAGLDLDRLGNIYGMASTADPREFYRVTRLLLVPSLWEETFGRVAAEALLNGIPVLASGRGGLPEVLREAGFLFDLPERYTATSAVLPAAAEVAPWVETITRLWDDSGLYDRERRRCLAAAEAWRSERVGACYDEFLTRVAEGTAPPPVA
jgi:glycosyltransferase involved in cell wall biosynthesis